MKIRRGKLSIGVAEVGNVKNVNWNDQHEFDRSATDEQMAGPPVEMKHGGSGSLTMTAGDIASGYSDDWVIAYNQVEVAAGVETVTTKTVTFTGVTVNQGGSLDNDSGPGSKEVSFEYSTSVEA